MLRYLSIAARMTNPSTTLTRAIQPPLRGKLLQIGRKQREEEERSREAGGERDHSEHRLHSLRLNGRGQQRADERTDAGKRGQRERQAHQQGADISAAARRAVEFRQQSGGQRDFERAEQAQAEGEEHGAMKAFTQGLEPS